ncbi:MAG: dienelactone hydrolase family protein [Flavihumibacter sp.]
MKHSLLILYLLHFLGVAFATPSTRRVPPVGWHPTGNPDGKSRRAGAGRELAFETPDGGTARAWEWKAPRKTAYTILLFHSSWGLTSDVRQEAEKLSNALGINVLAVDMYNGKLATSSEEAVKLAQSVDEDRASAIIEGAFSYLGEQQKIFSLGWSFGGGWSLQSAIFGGSQMAGCIIYYGALEQSQKKLQLLHCDVIGFFGNQDKWPGPAQVADFKMNMEKAGKKFLPNRYPGGHGFANPGIRMPTGCRPPIPASKPSISSRAGCVKPCRLQIRQPITCLRQHHKSHRIADGPV